MCRWGDSHIERKYEGRAAVLVNPQFNPKKTIKKPPLYARSAVFFITLRDDFTISKVVEDVHKHFFGIDEFVKAKATSLSAVGKKS